jgi:hypothetical protein
MDTGAAIAAAAALDDIAGANRKAVRKPIDMGTHATLLGNRYASQLTQE